MAGKWDDEDYKAEIKQAYLDSDPKPETNQEILQELGITYEVSPNSIRVFLTKEGVYVAKKPVDEGSTEVKATGSKRIPKEQSIKNLKALITSKGKAVDDAIVDKLTGKAAEYFIEILS